MGVIADVLSGLRKTILLQDTVERLEKNLEAANATSARLREYVGSIDRRLTHLEGFIQGASANAGRDTPRLSRD